MKAAAIKVGRWYETKMGVGKCVQSGGTFPPSVQVEVVAPFPRGRVNLVPKDVIREVDAPQASASTLTSHEKETLQRLRKVALGEYNADAWLPIVRALVRKGFARFTIDRPDDGVWTATITPEGREELGA